MIFQAALKRIFIKNAFPIASDSQEIYVAILTPPSAYRPINVQAVMDFFVEKWQDGKAWQV